MDNEGKEEEWSEETITKKRKIKTEENIKKPIE